MKKLIYILSIVTTLLMVGCNIKDNNSVKVEDNINNQATKELAVNIEADKEKFSSMDYTTPWITFMPKLEGATDKEIEYHWIIENEITGDREFYAEQFIKEDVGGTIEIVNSGEHVELGLFAIVCYVDNNTVSEFSIILKIEEKGTDNILAEDKLVIENRAGEYKIKSH